MPLTYLAMGCSTSKAVLPVSAAPLAAKLNTTTAAMPEPAREGQTWSVLPFDDAAAEPLLAPRVSREPAARGAELPLHVSSDPQELRLDASVQLLYEFDRTFEEAIKDAAIRLLNVDKLHELERIQPRQKLEERDATAPESPGFLLSAMESVTLLKKQNRSVGMLTYGWRTSDRGAA